ncbi:hypothetical protein D918_07143 [Trichuris suis]|nr:hypothetical protein D918_07143 [Trichuris suis]
MPKEFYADIACRDEHILPSDLLQGTGFMNSVSPSRRCPLTASQHRQLLKAAMINRMEQHFAPVAFPYPPLPFQGPIIPAPTLPLNHRHGLPVQMALPPFRPSRPKPPRPSVIEYMMLNMYLSAQLDRRRERMERIARCEALCAEMTLQDSECPPCLKA